MDLFVCRKWEVMSKVYVVVFIDLDYYVGYQLGSDGQLLVWIKYYCCEWVISFKFLDKFVVIVLKKEFFVVFVGIEKYSLVFFFSFQLIFKYFKKVLKVKMIIIFF